MSEIKEYPELKNLAQINITNEMFPPPPYTCVAYRRENPLLAKLTNPVYREDWEQLVSSTTGEKFPVYRRTVGDYDDYEEEIISYQEWMLKYQRRPVVRIVYLEAQILRAKLGEQAAGIHHYERTTTWFLPEIMQKIDLPKLKTREPENAD